MRALDFTAQRARLAAPVVTKHEEEFQEVCEALEPYYGKLIWTLPYIKGITEHNIRKAHHIAVKRGVIRFDYLRGIIKRLP